VWSGRRLLLSKEAQVRCSDRFANPPANRKQARVISLHFSAWKNFKTTRLFLKLKSSFHINKSQIYLVILVDKLAEKYPLTLPIFSGPMAYAIHVKFAGMTYILMVYLSCKNQSSSFKLLDFVYSALRFFTQN